MTGPHHSLSRRRVIAAAGTVAALPLAGCNAVVEWVADRALGDVNVANATDRPVAGQISVTDPAGVVVLDEPFEVAPDESDGGSGDGSDDSSGSDGGGDSSGSDGGGDSSGSDGSDGGSDDASQAVFEDVWTDAGDYDVEVQIEDGADAVGAEETAETVTVENVDEEKLLVVLGDDGLDEPIATLVFEDLQELEQYGE